MNTSKKSKDLIKTEPLQPHRAEKKEEKHKEGYIICLNCSLVYFNKRWQETDPKEVDHIKKNEEVKYDLCPECRKSKNVAPDGVVEIIGITIDDNMWNLIKNTANEEKSRDFRKRILEIKKKKDKVEVWTQSKELATTLGKKIHNAYKKKSDLEIDWLHKGDFVRVYLRG
ncbi:MAG: hypothetical protein HY776_00740 [Actinobacteria bacterium]|nr:hypothetical protein [Actinomycetota bacterium]